jgi:hypothetical protein
MSDGGSYVLVWLIIWVAFGFFGGVITKSKGRGAGIGWVLGLLLGGIGLIIAAVMREERPPAPGAPYRANDGKWYAQQPDGWHVYDPGPRQWIKMPQQPVLAMSDQPVGQPSGYASP